MRVIAGELGGRRLIAPPGRDTRPTSDRVREAMFMALEPLRGMRVVDLFAGSGALGIEALSRGASHATFVESDATARQALHDNLGTLALEAKAVILPYVLPRELSKLEAVLTECDLVMLDPPYRGTLAIETLEALAAPGTLRSLVRVVVEHHAKGTLPERVGRLVRRRARQFGETAVTTYDVASANEAGDGEESR